MKGSSTVKALPRWQEDRWDGGVCIVFDEDDRTANTRFAHELNSPTDGRLAVDITPGTRKTYELASDVLDGFGKRVDMTGASNTSHETWFRACAWIVGERIRDIIVCRAHLLDGYRWRRLIELAAIANARLWLMMSRPSLSRGQKETARDWQIATMGFGEFRRRWQHAASAAEATPEPQRAFLEVPDEEFPTFLATSEGLLAAEPLARVRDVYWTAHRNTLEWFDRHGEDAERPADALAIAEFLHGLLAPIAGLPERLVGVRATQAAAFTRGWLLKLDQRALAGAHFAAPLSAPDEVAANALRLYGHPRYAGAALISLASREPASAMVAVNIGDVQPDGSKIRIAGREVEIPEFARGIIRALMALRLSEGATTYDPLFVSEKRDPGGRNGRAFKRTTKNGLRGRLTSVAIDTGLFVVTPEVAGEKNPKRWLGRQGLTVHRLASRARP